MNSNDTSTIDTSTIGRTTLPTVSPAGRPRLWALVGGVVAVGALTFGVGAALAQDSPATVPAVGDHAAIAEMARANGLTGLSPASLAPASVPSEYGDNAAVADWARTNGLSGLSPASLGHTDD